MQGTCEASDQVEGINEDYHLDLEEILSKMKKMGGSEEQDEQTMGTARR